MAEDLATKALVLDELGKLRVEMHREFSNMKGVIIATMIPLWLGVYGTLITLLLRR